MAKGWIRLDRSIEDNWVWTDKPFSKGQAWIDLILLADYRDNTKVIRNEEHRFRRGTVYRSISFLAERWGWSRGKVRRFIEDLQSDGMLIAEKKRTAKRTENGHPNGHPNGQAFEVALTLIKYGFYQGDEIHDGHPNGQQNGQKTDSKTDTYNKYINNKTNIYSKNRFCDFEQNDYAFTKLEEEILDNGK